MEITHGSVTWLDMRLVPHNEEEEVDPELEELARRFHLHPVVVKELSTPSARSRVEAYKDYLFLIYQFPVYDHEEKVSRRAEIDLIISKDRVITVRYDGMTTPDGFVEKLEDPDFAATAFKDTLQLTYHLVNEILFFNQRQLRHIREKVEEASAGLFKDNERDMLRHISYLKRDISEYRVIFNPQAQVLNSLQLAGMKFWGPESEPYLSDLVGNHLRLMNQLEDYRAAARDFEGTNNQLLDIKNGEVMKTFTVLAFLTFPLTFIAALFTVPLQGVPFIGHPYGWWIVAGLMIITASGMLAYFKGKGWL